MWHHEHINLSHVPKVHEEQTSEAVCSRLRLKCNGTRAETRFRLSAKRTSPFKSAGASVQSTTGSRGMRNIGSNAGYTKFRGSVKSTGYPLHSPVSPSLPLQCVTVCHHISTDCTEPPFRHCGYCRNARLGPEWLASTIQLFCAIKTHCVHSVSCLQGYRNMHTMCRGWVVGLILRFRKKILRSRSISQPFSHHSQTTLVTLITRILTNPEVLTCSDIRHREVIYQETKTSLYKYRHENINYSLSFWWWYAFTKLINSVNIFNHQL
jgi:hypothetical protein